MFDVAGAGIWALSALGGLVALDTVVPLLPAEAAVIAASAAAGSPAAMAAVLAVTVVGAAVGDLALHLVGRRFGRSRLAVRLRRRVGDRPARLGGAAVVFGRFVPGGRTAIAFGSGMVAMPARRFALSSAAGAALWALYVVGLGRLGARVTSNTVAQVAVGLAVAVVVALVASVLTRRRRRRQRPAGRARRTKASRSSAVWSCQRRIVGSPGGASA